MGFLSLLGGSKAMLLALAGMAVAAIVGALFLRDHLRDRELQLLAAAKAVQDEELADAKRVNDANATMVAQYQAEIARQARIAAQERQARAASEARLATLTRRISDAKPDDDGPVARVLRDALDGLHGSDAAATAR